MERRENGRWACARVEYDGRRIRSKDTQDTQARTSTHTHAGDAHAHAQACTRTRTLMHTHTHAPIHTHTHTHRHTCKHIHACTHLLPLRTAAADEEAGVRTLPPPIAECDDSVCVCACCSPEVRRGCELLGPPPEADGVVDFLPHCVCVSGWVSGWVSVCGCGWVRVSGWVRVWMCE